VRGLVGVVVGKLGLLGSEVFKACVQARYALLAALGGEPALLGSSEGSYLQIGKVLLTAKMGQPMTKI
jgi:hypothetical protein